MLFIDIFFLIQDSIYDHVLLGYPVTLVSFNLEVTLQPFTFLDLDIFEEFRPVIL